MWINGDGEMKLNIFIINVILFVFSFTILIIGIFMISENSTRETSKMCVIETTKVYVKPDNNSQILYVISERKPIWYSGVRNLNWLFIDFENGSGWIRSNDFMDCPPENFIRNSEG